MKKNVLCIAILACASSMNLYAMGLGDITVNSYLDQPFNAEIELIDVGNTPLSGIKASLASVEDYEKVGLEQAYALSYLSFSVEQNAKGKPVIKVRSIERISEPYVQLLVDLAWVNGQIYRSYTILLDPPNYRLGMVKKQLRNIVKRQSELEQTATQTGVVNKSVSTEVERSSTTTVVDHRGATTYGPTVANETVWQIAQRYKTENIILQQMILAIVGTNPGAFTEGNLNGLKEGSNLLIPKNITASRVPLALAKLEVIAHDTAWQSRQAIQHALLPPYINSSAPKDANEQEKGPLGYPLSQSVIPSILEPENPEFDSTKASSLLPLAASLLSFGENKVPINNLQTKTETVFPVKVKVARSITTAAIESAHEANALLIEQLHSLQKENKSLQQQSASREQEIGKLREEMRLLIARQGLAGQASQQQLIEEKGGGWLLILFLLGLGVGGGFVYWWLWVRLQLEKKNTRAENSSTQPLDSTIPPIFQDILQEQDTTATLVEKKETIIPEPAVFEEKQGIDLEEIQHENVTGPSVEVEKASPVTLDLEGKPTVVVSSSELERPAGLSVEEKTPTVELGKTENQELENLPIAGEKSSSEPIDLEIKHDNTGLKEQATNEDNTIEFSSELLQEIEDTLAEKMPLQTGTESELEKDDTNSIDFVLTPVESVSTGDAAKPVKSKAALETLLALAKTYIEMDDIEMAKQSLQEVLDFGNKKQKTEATKLLDELDKK